MKNWISGCLFFAITSSLIVSCVVFGFIFHHTTNKDKNNAYQNS